MIVREGARVMRGCAMVRIGRLLSGGGGRRRTVEAALDDADHEAGDGEQAEHEHERRAPHAVQVEPVVRPWCGMWRRGGVVVVVVVVEVVVDAVAYIVEKVAMVDVAVLVLAEDGLDAFESHTRRHALHTLCWQRDGRAAPPALRLLWIGGGGD